METCVRPKDKTSCEVFAEDRERINALARELTEDGPGRFGQAETVRYLIDWRIGYLRAVQMEESSS
jgi:hypothetical protein